MFPDDPFSALTGPMPTSVLDASLNDDLDDAGPVDGSFALSLADPLGLPKEEELDLSFLGSSWADAPLIGLKDEWSDESLQDLVPFIPDEAWNGTDGLMTAVLGQDQGLSGVTLNDDVFMVANKETAMSVFPVCPFELRVIPYISRMSRRQLGVSSFLKKKARNCIVGGEIVVSLTAFPMPILLAFPEVGKTRQ